MIMKCVSSRLYVTYMNLPASVFYKIYIVYRDFITILIFVSLSFTIIPIFTFSGAFVREIQ